MGYQSSLKVRFCETDALGHINNTSYFIYMEEARVQFFESIGFIMDAKNWQFIMAQASCDFLDQAHFNDELVVITSVTHLGTKSFHMEHLMKNAVTGRPVAKGKSVIVTYEFQEQKSIPIPGHIRAELEKHMAAASISE
ncbi:acyl-CoA thioesterase [Metabacillus sp. RGM 3146]|uniref:acyl-CoA thioesterase n=1 Tax=Metabacillus sp. RGM 3146 TaxID=3401092 RepID=UPI003B9D5C33